MRRLSRDRLIVGAQELIPYHCFLVIYSLCMLGEMMSHHNVNTIGLQNIRSDLLKQMIQCHCSIALSIFVRFTP